jgi:hypothetical protein
MENIDEIYKIKLEDYCCLLARIIEINSSTKSMEGLDLLCEVAIKKRGLMI